MGALEKRTRLIEQLHSEKSVLVSIRLTVNARRKAGEEPGCFRLGNAERRIGVGMVPCVSHASSTTCQPVLANVIRRR